MRRIWRACSRGPPQISEPPLQPRFWVSGFYVRTELNSLGVALVTGGDRGIGFATAVELADQGYSVAVTNRHAELEDSRILSVPCDVSVESSLLEMTAQVAEVLGPIDVVVANAGGPVGASPAAFLSYSQARANVDLNLLGPIALTRMVLPTMIKRRKGRLIYVSSAAADKGASFASAYAASKSGLYGYCRSLVQELGGSGITANVVAPGIIDSALTSKALGSSTSIRNVVPIGSAGSPRDVANAISFLASERASYITGVVLPVDGGLVMGR
jgi:NAD(P)-dependent dehydrogenase (short-subunit alcohol dehydrogenase family)